MRLPAAIACALLASCGSGEPCGYPGNYCPVPPMPAKSTVSARQPQARAVAAVGPGASWVSLRPAGNCATGHPEQMGLQPDEATARDVGAVKTEHRAARCVGQAAPIQPSQRVSSGDSVIGLPPVAPTFISAAGFPVPAGAAFFNVSHT